MPLSLAMNLQFTAQVALSDQLQRFSEQRFEVARTYRQTGLPDRSLSGPALTAQIQQSRQDVHLKVRQRSRLRHRSSRSTAHALQLVAKLEHDALGRLLANTRNSNQLLRLPAANRRYQIRC